MYIYIYIYCISNVLNSPRLWRNGVLNLIHNLVSLFFPLTPQWTPGSRSLPSWSVSFSPEAAFSLWAPLWAPKIS